MHRRSALRSLTSLVLGALLVAACADGEVAVDDARSRMSPMFAGVGAVYLDVTNATGQDDRLVAASVNSSVAASVEIHETFDTDGMDHGEGDPEEGPGGGEGMPTPSDDGMDDDAEPSAEGFAMMGMREIQGLDVPAGETVELVPGGYHLMLIDLATDLEVGDEFELVLEFEHAGARSVTVTVRDDV